MMQMTSGDQWLSKCACKVNTFRDLHVLYNVAKATERRHVVLGMGELGMVTRIRQDVLGNLFTFAYSGQSTAPGQLSVDEMDSLGEDPQIVGILGHPLSHSKSPAMQNAAMEKAGIKGRYLVFDSPDLNNLTDVIREYRIRGMNVTIPYKQDVSPMMDSLEGPAETIGAVNTIINDGGKLIGTNTDVAGIIHAFGKTGKELSEHSKVLIHGTGGAARAAVYAAMSQDCEVTVMGRTLEHVSSLCEEAGCEAFAGGSISGYDAVINCTPVGMKEDSDYLFDINDIRGSMTVLDMVYNRKTALVRAAEARGSKIAKGSDMLVGQGAESFRLWFGKDPDIRTMEDSLRAGPAPPSGAFP
jgi:3-dehydroquinate dehydratase/shikimate dehydrogenase